MQIEIQTSLQYGLLFLYDPYSEVRIPEDAGESFITTTDNCVCFQVNNYIDGNANITLSNLPPPHMTSCDKFLRISSPSKHISLTDVPVNYYAILKIKDDFADIKIRYMEDITRKEKVWVQILNLDIF